MCPCTLIITVGALEPGAIRLPLSVFRSDGGRTALRRGDVDTAIIANTVPGMTQGNWWQSVHGLDKLELRKLQ